MNNSTTGVTHGFRASCERCRAQKLRCVPSSDTDTGAPCQRCARSKSARTCVFGQRSRVGRGKAKASSRSGEINTSSQGMPESSPVSDKPLHTNVASPNSISEIGIDSVMGASLDTLWDQDVLDFGSMYFSLSAQTSSPEMSFSTLCNDFSHADGLATSDNSISGAFDVGRQLDIQDPTFSSAGHDEMTSKPDAPHTRENPGELVDLSTLVAEMSPYEKYISNSTDLDLQDYPIGDVIYFSQRFKEIISAGSPTEAFSQSHMPTTLLALSCYLTLTRTYLSVFTYLHNHLSRRINEHEQHGPHGGFNITPSCLAQGKPNTFRGLRFQNFKPLCLCASWDPIKKAVSMLISALASIEASLELPRDLRIVISSANDLKTDESQLRGRRESLGDKAPLGNSLIIALTKSLAFKTFRSQLRELRARVGDLEELLSL